MVSKNNRIKKMEKSAERKPHFAIRKLTIGAASVLLGTSLWLAVDSSTSHAAETDSNGEREADQSNQAIQSIDENTHIEVQADATNNSTPAISNADQTQSTNVDKANTNSAEKQTDAINQKSIEVNVDKVATNKTKEIDQSQPAKTEGTVQNNRKAASATTQNQNKVANNATTNNKTATVDQTQKAVTTDANTVANNVEKQITRNTASVQGTNTETTTADATNNLDIGESGLAGKTTKLDLKSGTNSLLRTAANTSNIADNKVVANNLSQQELNALMASFVTVPNTTGSGNSAAVDLSAYTPDFNITNNSDYNTYFSNIPSTQFGFQAHRDNRNGAILTLATDKDNPGDKIYFYVNGSLKATIDKNAATAPWSGTMNISQTNGNVYKGGTYNYSRSTVTIGGYKYTKVAVEDADGKSPVNVPTTGAFTTGGANLVPLGIGSSELAQKQWQSGGGVIPDKAHQTIWYVNADTGEVMASKTSGYVFDGQSYDVTDAAPEKVTYNGKTYEAVARDSDGNYTNVSQNTLNSVLTNNNGVNITVGDVIDTPLKGTLGSSRKGDIYVSTTDYGPSRIYIFSTNRQ
ncbi:YSIRK-type signal peptide-containing protein [Lactobacillus crispatus]|uniref:YSIRK-type signal peptide-containing protein n=1 Tax=Lactobacillus crispatus TaxID=47770 RepID=UPI000C7AB6D4|nr:YSIRK-type signal peptide-containing protein [Lactobacillus crispatus]PKZ85140.1 hypothetical protein CYJ83_05220 [Lactobacillus crispatus]